MFTMLPPPGLQHLWRRETVVNRPTETYNDLGRETVATNGYETDNKSSMNLEGAEVDAYTKAYVG